MKAIKLVGGGTCSIITPLNSDIKDSLKKFSLLFRQAKMVFVIIWFLNHFTLEYVLSMNSI